MGQLAVGIAGGIAGVAIGVATGGVGFAALATYAAVGLSVGTMVGGILFPAQVRQEGSRLGDLSVQSSAYGAVRPIGYGRIRLAGNVIWALPIKETRTEAKSGGKGGPTVTNITYTYSISFALALCEGPVDKVLRIWADSKLVYDASVGTDAIKRPGFKFRFYPGSTTQLADSIIEADKGTGNVPGYRGTCYLLFDDIPLADYGNRIPNMTCEIVFSSTAAHDYVPLVRASPSIFGSLDPFAAGIDWLRGVGYLQGENPAGILVYDTATMQTLREVPMTAILSDGSDGSLDTDVLGGVNSDLFVGPDGALYFAVSLGTYLTKRLVRVDPNTMRETGTFPAHLVTTNTTTSFSTPKYFASISLFDTTGALTHFLVSVSFFGDVGVLFLPSMTYGAGAGMRVTGIGRAAVAGKIALGVGDAWVLSMTSTLLGANTHLYLSRIRNGETSLLVTPSGSVLTEMGIFSATDFDAGADGFTTTPGSLSYDESDDSLVFKCETALGAVARGTYLVKWSPESGTVFIAQMTNGTGQWNSLPSRISGGTFAQFSITHLYMVDSATGATSLDEAATGGGMTDWPIGLSGGTSAQLYDSSAQAIFAYVYDGSSTFWAKVRLGRSAALTTTLGDIVSDQCLRSGFDEADFDTTALTDVIDGFVVSQRASVVDVLTPLLGVYLVDAVETDYVLVFKHRGGTSLVSLAEDDLIRISDAAAEPYTETRQQEIELPMRLTLTYIDADSDFQTNTQIAKRVRNPDPTVFSDNQADVNIAVVSTTTPMKQRAEMMLYSAWNERHQFAVRLPPQYAYLDTADPVTVVFNDGYTVRARLGPVAFGGDYVTDTKLIAETDGQYTSTAAADAASAWGPSHSLATFALSKLILLDTPLLRDIDDLGGRAIRGYWSGGTYQTNATDWPGTILQQSDDASTWNTLEATGSGATWGYVDTPPADTTALFSIQYDGSLIVVVTGGDYAPSSVTDLALANGSNPLALIKANGDVEIIQYRDTSALGAGRYALSVLRRAQRGTDTMANGHAAGETFVFLDTGSTRTADIALAQRNTTEFYRAVTNGTLSQLAAVSSFVFHGRDLMPYAPVNFVRTLSSSPPDLILGWQRRTRIGGAMIDGSDSVPLAETSEAYEAYIIASTTALAAFSPTNPATYIRAFTGLIVPTVTYTAAMMATDGFTEATDTLHLVVYQLSGVVGRGFRGYQALESDEPGYLEPSAPAPAIPPAVGDFTISGTTILDPEGVPWLAHGLNIYDNQVADVVTNDACEPLLTLFPGLKVVRLNNFDYIAPDDADMLAFVTRLTAKGIVVIAEDHYGISATPLTGSALAIETAWYASWAAYHIDNPRVWFGAPNEPGLQLGGAAVTDQQVAVYNAIRATGSAALVGMIPPGGGNPGTVGDGFGLTTSAYATMTRAFWELHFYGWTSDFSTTQSVVDAALAGSISGGYGIAAVNTIPFADGVGPIIIGEFGISTDGETPDANGNEVLAAVAASGRPWTAWHWYSFAGSDNCTDGAGNITAYGIQVAALIAAG
jgi:putative tail protein/cellulase (glycosyl hydrolase family 5)